MSEIKKPRNMDFFGTFLSTMAEIGHTPTKQEVDSASTWGAVGNCLLDAMVEKAEELGGNQFRNEIAAIAQTEVWLIPNARALIELEKHTPGSAEQTVKLAETMLLGKMTAEQVVSTKSIGS
jgi:hypothetical protein